MTEQIVALTPLLPATSLAVYQTNEVLGPAGASDAAHANQGGPPPSRERPPTRLSSDFRRVSAIGARAIAGLTLEFIADFLIYSRQYPRLPCVGEP
jgi:hypothetical protein